MDVMDVRLWKLIKRPEHQELWQIMPQCSQCLFKKKITVNIDCLCLFDRLPNLLAHTQNSRICISCQTTNSDLDEFFRHESAYCATKSDAKKFKLCHCRWDSSG